jgi:pimeloyl-ACP methyl ester carboxylesterase
MFEKIQTFVMVCNLLGACKIVKTLKQSGYASANGIRIYFELHGSGPFLTLIGGLGTATWLWEQNIPTLSKHFTVLAYDNRGAGKSDIPEGPYTIQQMAQDLAGLLQYLNIARTHLLGVSMGGYIAQEFALDYPEYVDHLILAATTPGKSQTVPMAPEVMELLITPSEGNKELMRRKFALAFTHKYLDRQMDKLIEQRLSTPQPPAAYLAQAAAGAAFDRSDDLHNIHHPTLVVGATGDRIIPIENIHRLAALIPNTQTIVYEGFAHQFVVENAATFNRDVIAFLTK